MLSPPGYMAVRLSSSSSEFAARAQVPLPKVLTHPVYRSLCPACPGFGSSFGFSRRRVVAFAPSGRSGRRGGASPTAPCVHFVGCGVLYHLACGVTLVCSIVQYCLVQYCAVLRMLLLLLLTRAVLYDAQYLL